MVAAPLVLLLSSVRVLGGAGNEFAYRLIPASGGLFLAGHSGSYGAGAKDIFCAKVGLDGSLIRATVAGTPFEDDCYHAEAYRGGVVAGGNTLGGPGGGGDFLTVAFDGSGGLLWATAFGGPGGDYGYGAIETPAGGVLVVGATNSWGSGGNDVMLAFLDSAGQFERGYATGSAAREEAFRAAFTPAGEIIFCGHTDLPGRGTEGLVGKVDTLGNVIWAVAIGESGGDWLYAVEPAPDGGCWFSGFTNSSGAGETDILVGRLDESGALVWAGTVGGAGIEYCFDIVMGSDSTLLVAGYTESYGAGGRDLLLLELDTAGYLLSTFSYGGSGEDHLHSARKLPDGSLFVAGHTDSWGAGGVDILFGQPLRSGVCFDGAFPYSAAPASVSVQSLNLVTLTVQPSLAAVTESGPAPFTDSLLCSSGISGEGKDVHEGGVRFVAGGVRVGVGGGMVTVYDVLGRVVARVEPGAAPRFVPLRTGAYTVVAGSGTFTGLVLPR